MAERTELSAGFRLAGRTVRPEDGSLSSPDSTRRLEPLLMDLLVFLCSRAGQVVPKQDLLDAVWGGRFVSDETIKGSLYQLRKALGDDPRRPQFIETLPKRGYRVLVQPVPLAPGPPAGSLKGEAREWCRKGRAALSGQPDAAALGQAKIYFERSTQADPESAEGWAGLAQTYVLMIRSGLGRGSDLLPRARAAASRAVELDPRLAAAHAALGVARFVLDHDFAAAEEEFHLALELAPGDSLARRWYARLLSSQSRQNEAVAEARRALEADPLSLPARRDLAEILLMARRTEEAVAEVHQQLDINPHSPDVQLALVWIYSLQKKDRQALAALVAGLESLGVTPPVVERARQAFEHGGTPAMLRLWAEALEHGAALGQKNQDDLLVLYGLLGDRDRCFELLETAWQEGNPYLFWLPVSPFFDSLRSDPRYLPFLARLGFPLPGE